MNDTAIALALQEELYQQDHQTNRHEHSSSNVLSLVGFDEAVTASDHQLACLLQEEFDDEMAHDIHQQQQHHHQTPTPIAAQYTNDTPSNNLGVTSGQPVYIPPPVPPNQSFNESTASNEELSYEVRPFLHACSMQSSLLFHPGPLGIRRCCSRPHQC
jgi:hypothetical protein